MMRFRKRSMQSMEERGCTMRIKNITISGRNWKYPLFANDFSGTSSLYDPKARQKDPVKTKTGGGIFSSLGSYVQVFTEFLIKISKLLPQTSEFNLKKSCCKNLSSPYSNMRYNSREWKLCCVRFLNIYQNIMDILDLTKKLVGWVQAGCY